MLSIRLFAHSIFSRVFIKPQILTLTSVEAYVNAGFVSLKATLCFCVTFLSVCGVRSSNYKFRLPRNIYSIIVKTMVTPFVIAANSVIISNSASAANSTKNANDTNNAAKSTPSANSSSLTSSCYFYIAAVLIS